MPLAQQISASPPDGAAPRFRRVVHLALPPPCVNDEGVRILYIGESVSLRQRASNYRNAKTDRSRQRTSRRIHQKVVAHLSAGGAIEFAIATAVVLADGRPADLRLTSARRLAENAAVLSAQMDPGVTVLNIDADLPDAGEAAPEGEP